MKGGKAKKIKFQAWKIWGNEMEISKFREHLFSEM